MIKRILSFILKSKPVYKYLFFLSFFGLILVLWFVIISTASNSSSFSKETNSKSSNYDQSSSLDCSGGWTDSVLCKERQIALSEIKISSELQIKLESMNVNYWGKVKFDSAKGLISQGDKLFKDEFFGKSAIKFSEANIILNNLDKLAKDLVLENLQKGTVYLEREDAAAAIEKFEMVLSIDSKDKQAIEGLSRALVLDKLLEILKEIQFLMNTGDLDLARKKMLTAIQIDNKNKRAKKLDKRLSDLIKERDIKNYLSRGFKQLEELKFERALSSFKSVIRLDSSSKTALSGIEEAKKGLKNQEILDLGKLAVSLQEREEWKQSKEVYNQILELDRNVQFAIRERDKVQIIIDLIEQLDRILSDPKRLSSRAVIEEANSIYEYSKSFANRGLKLKAKINSLSNVLDKYSTRLTLTIFSDSKTEVTVQRSSNLGKFNSVQVKLTPGNYQLIGKRKGYVTVRRKIELTEDSNVEIFCKDKI